MQSEELSSVPVKLLTLLGVPVALEREDILEADEEVSQYLHDTMSGRKLHISFSLFICLWLP